jgi:hypothetical protein
VATTEETVAAEQAAYEDELKAKREARAEGKPEAGEEMTESDTATGDEPEEVPPPETTEAVVVEDETVTEDDTRRMEDPGEAGAPDALFDKAAYDSPELALPKIDGEGVDKIAVAFNGRVLLDRTDPRDVELIRRMKLGQDVTLQVEGRVSKKGHGFTTNKEGDLDAVVFETAVRVETVYRPVLEGE